MRRAAVMVIAVGLLAACGSGTEAAHKDTYGDPYITDAQGQAVTVGEPASTAFAALGGQASSGSNGQQAVPPLTYDYPISGTGNADDTMDTKTIWWQVCITNGAVTGTHRATLDKLPAMGC